MAIISFIGKGMDTCNTNLHKHQHWELVYCIKGNITLSLEESAEKIRYGAGQAVLIPARALHYNIADGDYVIINVMIGGWKPNFHEALLVNDNSKKDLQVLLNMCLRYYILHSGADKDGLLDAFTRLLVATIYSIERNKGTSGPVEFIANGIIENFADPNFDLDDLFAKFTLSKDYLRRQFIREKGISPVQLLNKLRIQNAQKILANRSSNHYKINEIAQMCGFSDQLYFSRVFKKATGVSPKDYKPAPADQYAAHDQTR